MKNINLIMKDIYIIILNYNQKYLTTECINSILNSTYVNYKILVVDNGSKDGSVEYLSKLFRSKIEIIKNSNNPKLSIEHIPNSQFKLMGVNISLNSF